MLTVRSLVRLLRIRTLRSFARTFGSCWAVLPARSLIIAPHPDDETFGLGGMIALQSRSTALKNRKAEIHIVFLTSGGAAHRNCCGISPQELGALRERTARRATRLLGVPEENLYFLRLEDGAIPHPEEAGFDSAVLLLRSIVEQVKPDVIFAPHPFEGWSDHIAGEQMARRVLDGKLGGGQRRLSRQGASRKLCHYCVWVWFSMPILKAARIQWKLARLMALAQGPVNSQKIDTMQPSPNQNVEFSAFECKKAAINLYLEAKAPCGNPTCGVLPLELLEAVAWDRELSFLTRD